MPPVKHLSKNLLRNHLPFLTFCLLALTATVQLCGQTQEYSFHHQDVLGTTLELKITCANEQSAKAIESDVLEDIDRLDKILSEYNPNSEFSKWQRTLQEPVKVSSELYAVLVQAQRLQEKLKNAFHPGVGGIIKLWQQAENSQSLPDKMLLWKNTRKIKAKLWMLDVSRQTATRLVDVPLSINAMAKGYVIDSVGDKAMKSTEPPSQLVINVGGDLRIWGDRKTSVAITSPIRESDEPIAHVEFSDHAIATSGNYRRGFEIDGERFSHIVDPRTGRPTDDIPGVTVLAPTAATADAMATAFSVLTEEESLEIANRTPYVECLIVLKSGRQSKSKGWDSFSIEHAVAESKSKTGSANKELVIGFEIAKPANARRFRRPYVAVWVEDEDGFPVRTLVLWIQESRPGPKWHRDLRRWYNSDRFRQLVDDNKLIGTVSSATRPSGKYKTVWDGKDDNGDHCKTGKYTLFIESAREHGTYQLIQSEFQLGGEDFSSRLKGNVEISAASLDYRTSTRKTGT